MSIFNFCFVKLLMPTSAFMHKICVLGINIKYFFLFFVLSLAPALQSLYRLHRCHRPRDRSLALTFSLSTDCHLFSLYLVVDVFIEYNLLCVGAFFDNFLLNLTVRQYTLNNCCFKILSTFYFFLFTFLLIIAVIQTTN